MSRFVAWNRRCSKYADALLDQKGRRVDGCSDFVRVLQQYLRPALRVLDVGGGKNPVIPLALKESYQLNVTGVDVSREELGAAPAGLYDRTICCDICSVADLPEVDLAISRSVTEHTKNPVAMYTNIYRALRSGGLTVNFMPNKFAAFALVNSSLPHTLAKRIVDYFYPEMKEGQGFPAYYRKCFPSGMMALLHKIGFKSIQVCPYYRSEYLSFFVPLHLTELAWQLLTSRLMRPNLCEAFTISAQKP